MQRCCSVAFLLFLILAMSILVSAQLDKVNYYPISTDGLGQMGITAGPDGALWFSTGFHIGQLPLGGKAQEYPIPNSSVAPALIGIAPGSDGNVWFVMAGNGPGYIGRACATKSASCLNIGDITEYSIPTYFAFPYNITAGPDGNLWFVEADAGNIGRICAQVTGDCSAIGAITEYPAQGATGSPTGITAAPDGQIWFTAGHIISMNTAGVVTGSYALPAGDYPLWITAGPDGALWFIGDRYPAHYIGRICVEVSPNCPSIGALTDPPYFVSSDIDELADITPGADGAIWFAGFNKSGTSLIGRITTDGQTINYYDVAGAWGVTSGPDGAVWFAGGPQIGQALPSARRNGIDTSYYAGPISSAVAQSFVQAGVRYAVVKIPQKPRTTLNNRRIAREQLNALHSAGIKTAGYCYLYFDANAQTGKQQVQNCLNTLIEGGSLQGELAFMAIDVEDTTKPEYSDPHGLIQTALDRITAALGPGKAVIYTAEYFWDPITGNDTGFNDYPLWTAATYSFESYVDPAGELYCFGASGLVPNQNKSGPNGIPSLQSFVPFAGWSQQHGNQYDIGYLHNGSRSQCLFGKIVDFDVFDGALFGSRYGANRDWQPDGREMK